MSEDQLQPSDSLDDRGVDDVLDEGYSPPDRETENLRHPHDPEDPETLDERLAEEEPESWESERPEPGEDDIVDGDVGGEVGHERTGRLVAEDEGAGEDDDAEMWAADEGIDGAGASAEEAAVHTIDEE
jgi:hypothetical protein